MANGALSFRVLTLVPLLWLMLPALSSAADKLLFTTAPTQPVQKTLEMYGPLVEFLSERAGVEIELRPVRSFLEYTIHMQRGEYDIYFDGPHFASWRMQHQGHRVLAKLPGEIRFVVVVRDDAGIDSIKELAGKRVCGFSSPNLLTLGFLDLYANPASQPQIVAVKSFMDSLRCVQAGRGIASVMRDKFWEKRKPEEREGLHQIHISEAYPHRAFTIRGDVDAEIRGRLTAALLSEEGIRHGEAILKRFRVQHFSRASDAEYEGFYRLLNSTWGF
ncbi:MAG TPA: phosphate/phosphite/phosphonate ABC transporter substrate-binding protein [Thiotrichales bacterium]|nr:phosphate/phosphite/phosphonate ABC transporter substrate-binding protein [Thiotrichales bacterium]